MHYVMVEWAHEAADEPVRLLYELDADGHEQRKVEEYRDGTMHTADTAHGQGTTFLAWEAHPSLAQINADPQFQARAITAQEFEQAWRTARQSSLQTAAG